MYFFYVLFLEVAKIGLVELLPTPRMHPHPQSPLPFPPFQTSSSPGGGARRGLPAGQGVSALGKARGRGGGGDHGDRARQPGAGGDHAAQDGPGEDAGHLPVPPEELLQDGEPHHQRLQVLRHPGGARLRQ